MAITAVENPLEKGLAALEHGHTYLAMTCLQQAMESGKTPLLVSWLAYCMALNFKDMDRAVTFAREALLAEPERADICLNAGRTLLIAGFREEAIRAFRLGLATGRDERLIVELDRLGNRRQPLFRKLPRGHFLNRCGGLLLSRLGLR
ncbi:MAG TPA: hypothetical protein VFF53_12145 [Geobacteraceae bacterium]|nr:hypothetical protein [Geobacteraceae bacterium]